MQTLRNSCALCNCAHYSASGFSYKKAAEIELISEFHLIDCFRSIKTPLRRCEVAKNQPLRPVKLNDVPCLVIILGRHERLERASFGRTSFERTSFERTSFERTSFKRMPLQRYAIGAIVEYSEYRSTRKEEQDISYGVQKNAK